MSISVRFAGVELYFNDLPAARRFYTDVLGLPVQEDQPQHHVQLAVGDRFLCLEGKGLEEYVSGDKAVLFLEVADLDEVLARIPKTHVAKVERTASQPWAAVRDPEGHTVMLLEARPTDDRQPKPAA